MMDNISPPIRKLLAVSLVILPFLFLLNFLVFPILNWYSENSDMIEKKRNLLSRYQIIIRNAPDLNTLAKTPEKTDFQHFLQAPNETLAQAQLQAKLKQIIILNRANVRLARSLTSLTKNDIRFIGISVDFVGSHSQIYKIIHQIEGSSPFLFIETADLRSREFGSRFDIYQPSRLLVRLNVYAGLKTDQKL